MNFQKKIFILVVFLFSVITFNHFSQLRNTNNYPRSNYNLELRPELAEVFMSGVYLDLWVEEQVEVRCKTPKNFSKVSLVLEVPTITTNPGTKNNIVSTLAIHSTFSQEVNQFNLTPGKHNLVIPVKGQIAPNHLGFFLLRFSGGVKIPPDTRLLRARLMSFKLL